MVEYPYKDVLLLKAPISDFPVRCWWIIKYSAGHPKTEEVEPATMAMPIFCALLRGSLLPDSRTFSIVLFTPNWVAIIGNIAPAFIYKTKDINVSEASVQSRWPDLLKNVQINPYNMQKYLWGMIALLEGSFSTLRWVASLQPQSTLPGHRLRCALQETRMTWRCNFSGNNKIK